MVKMWNIGFLPYLDFVSVGGICISQTHLVMNILHCNDFMAASRDFGLLANYTALVAWLPSLIQVVYQFMRP